MEGELELSWHSGLQVLCQIQDLLAIHPTLRSPATPALPGREGTLGLGSSRSRLILELCQVRLDGQFAKVFVYQDPLFLHGWRSEEGLVAH